MADRRNEQAGLPGISLRDTVLAGDRHAHPWRYRRAFLLRALAVVELTKALLHWATLIGAGDGPNPLADKTAGWLVGSVFFAVADPVAAVGLWIGAAWGVVIWLLAAVGQLIFVAMTPQPSWLRWLVIGLTALAMAAYLFVSLKAQREEHQH